MSIDIIEVRSTLVAETSIGKYLCKDTVRKTSVGNTSTTIDNRNVTSVTRATNIFSTGGTSQVVFDAVVDVISGRGETAGVVVNVRTPNTDFRSPRVGWSLNPSTGTSANTVLGLFPTQQVMFSDVDRVVGSTRYSQTIGCASPIEFGSKPSIDEGASTSCLIGDLVCFADQVSIEEESGHASVTNIGGRRGCTTDEKNETVLAGGLIAVSEGEVKECVVSGSHCIDLISPAFATRVELGNNGRVTVQRSNARTNYEVWQSCSGEDTSCNSTDSDNTDV